jgi:adenosine 3'-phospho 5'-phosphosulfate transporter B3
MQYINYPAKTLMKSSRVVFTMMFGVIITGKTYKLVDYLIVLAMVAGLVMFMHADANSSAVFHQIGVSMLTVSLVCDGAITNMSESIMNNFGVGQDEFIFRMYSIALIAISAAAAYKGDMREGIMWLSQPGTYDELALPISERTWSVPAKITCLIIFSSMGFFGSSCSAAITKNFGALTMSITSTARKATTLFLSFSLFNNTCTPEHVSGIVIFMSALTAKSLRRRGGSGNSSSSSSNRKGRRKKRAKLELPPGVSDNSSPSSNGQTEAIASESAEETEPFLGGGGGRLVEESKNSTNVVPVHVV